MRGGIADMAAGRAGVPGHRAREPVDPARRRRRHLRRQRRGQDHLRQSGRRAHAGLDRRGTGRQGHASDRPPHPSRRQPLSRTRIARSTPRSATAPCTRSTARCSGARTARRSGSSTPRRRSATAASWSAPSSCFATSASAARPTRSCARRSPRSTDCASGWNWKTPICRKKSASRPTRAASSARARRSRRRCARSSWSRRPTAAVLITGESGTGKELIARAIHEASSRRDRPLIRVNCAAIPRELFESEFFGHVKGAFTGAMRDRIGRFELADGGTLFLDEVGEIPLELQGKLLRVLQEGNFERVGEERTRAVDVRVIAATNRDLEAGSAARPVSRGSLFPAQRVPGGVGAAARAARGHSAAGPAFPDERRQRLKSDLRLSEGDARRLQRYDWPGNVRELQNVIERAAILAQNGRLRIDLPETGRAVRRPAQPPEERRAAGCHDIGRDARPGARQYPGRACRPATARCSARAARPRCSTSSRPRWLRA